MKHMEEISMLQDAVAKGIKDLSSFKSTVSLTAFSPFKTALDALENANSLSEGILHPDLRTFIEANVPLGKGNVLGILDSKLASSINEEMGLNCQHSGVVPEITRGLRKHFHAYVNDFSIDNEVKAQLGLGHAYSRSKVKFNVHKVDNMIIQSIALLDQLDKDINTFSMRIREWYSYHFPELIKIVSENQLFIQAVQVIGDRKNPNPDMVEKLTDILEDDVRVQSVLDASRASMGMDISPVDLLNIQLFTKKVANLAEYRKKLFSYLCSRVNSVAPNLTALIGELVAARLISHAGSLTSLAKYPASTVQILGAEKALFRALKKKGNTPKYGLIFHSSFIGRAGLKNKGRISRFLANKCSIASRIDSFADIPTNVFGTAMHQQVEDRLKFFDSGDLPPKNVDVMAEALTTSEGERQKALKKERKRLKKLKKAGKLDESADVTMDTSEIKEEAVDEPIEEQTSKKKKKRKSQPTDEIEEDDEAPGMATRASPKRQKRQSGSEAELATTPKSEKKQKKRKSAAMAC